MKFLTCTRSCKATPTKIVVSRADNFKKMVRAGGLLSLVIINQKAIKTQELQTKNTQSSQIRKLK